MPNIQRKKTIEDVPLTGKRILVRVDFNVPLDDDLNITDDTRIRGVLPTINHLLDSGGKVVLASHLGRPKGAARPEMSLRPVAKRLSRYLHQEVALAPDCVGPEARRMVDGLPERGVLLLENLRFHAGEEKNDPAFAKELAAMGDVYVDDAFANAHRKHASMVGVPAILKPAVAGFLMMREINFFCRAMEEPVRPLAAIFGGAKVSDKIKAVMRLTDKVDKIVIGGGMAFTFLKAQGFGVGDSLVEPDMLDTAREIIAKCRERNLPLFLPVDAVVAKERDARAETRVVPAQEIPEGWMGLDIGPASIVLFHEALSSARTIVWNGPMGMFELAPFSKGTYSMVNILAESQALTILGGGDTDVAVHDSGKSYQIDYISTGGGAFLKLLEQGTLPGIDVLEDK
jgi:phosphoglycerate kinase